MADTRWNIVKEALLAVLDLGAEEREAALAALDDDIRDEVRALVEAEGSDGEMLDRSPALFDVGEVARAIPGSADLIGAEVGPYRIIEQIGRGGMGEVYLAERADGLTQRRVAVKVVRVGADTEAVLARFDAERRILGRLQHRGIARLLDAGRVEDVRPWIAMDYVDGQPITEYARSNGLSTDACVALLADTARIVHEAHRNLVVHRDLKPSNVLVRTDPDGVPEPVLLDFGIAKLLDTDDNDEALTETGKGPMTRAYAAPEQLRGEEATTATDVYALGLLLYEMLAGARPFADAGTPAEQEIAVLKTDPPPPSRLADSTTSGTGKRLRGDLDTICLTALEKEPTKRYASADALAADLQRHLDGLPITARPPTMGYRFQKFVRRHRAGVVASTLALLVALSAGVAHSVTVRAERDRAEAARAEAEAASDFLADVFVSASPFDSARRDTLRLRDLLDEALRRVDEDLDGQPVLQGRLLIPIATSFGANAQFERADSLFEVAEHKLAEGPAYDRAHLMQKRGELLVLWGGEVRQAEAIALYRSALAIPGGFPDAVKAAKVQYELAIALNRNGEPEAADSLFQMSLATHRRVGIPDTAGYGIALGQYAYVLSQAGRDDEAIVAVGSALALLSTKLGSDHPHVAVEHYLSGIILHAAGRPAEALPHFRRSYEIDNEVLGLDHTNTLDGLQMQAVMLNETGQSARASNLLLQAVSRLESAYGGQDPRLPFYLYSYGAALLESGQLDEADRQFGRSVALMRTIHGRDSWGAGTVVGYQGRVALKRGDTARALPLLRQGHQIVLAALGPDNFRTRSAALALGEGLLAAGRKAEARRILAPIVPAFEVRFGASHERTRKVSELLDRAR